MRFIFERCSTLHATLLRVVDVLDASDSLCKLAERLVLLLDFGCLFHNLADLLTDTFVKIINFKSKEFET